jgi:hypothetical protein
MIYIGYFSHKTYCKIAILTTAIICFYITNYFYNAFHKQ